MSPQNLPATATPQDDFLIIGYIKGVWGTRGEIKVEVMTDFPDRFDPHRVVYLDHRPLTIERSRLGKNEFILKLSSIDTIESARQLLHHHLEIPLSEARALPEGEHYRFQILGLEVLTTRDERVGRIIDILPTLSNDVYVVRGTHKEVLIPAIADVVKSTDIDNGRMIIEPIDGLLD